MHTERGQRLLPMSLSLSCLVVVVIVWASLSRRAHVRLLKMRVLSADDADASCDRWVEVPAAGYGSSRSRRRELGPRLQLS